MACTLQAPVCNALADHGCGPHGSLEPQTPILSVQRCSFVDLTFYVSYTISSVVTARSLNQVSFCIVLASMNFPRSSIRLNIISVLVLTKYLVRYNI